MASTSVGASSAPRSRFKYLSGTVCKKELFYTNLKVNASAASAESSLIAANPVFFAVPYQTGGGGALYVHSLKKYGKAPDNPSLISGHTAPITDFQFNPFDHHMIATGSGDATIKLWKIPSADGLVGGNLTTPLTQLPEAHSAKVNLLAWHPTVSGLLLSNSLDLSVKLWDVSTSSCKQVLGQGLHTDVVQSVSWSYDGSMLLTSCKDKKVRMFDPRTNFKIVEGLTHEGSKGFKAVWLDGERFFTIGFNKGNDRQFFIYDLRKGLSKIMTSHTIDNAPGFLHPYYDEDTGVMFLAGKGDTTIKIFELHINGTAPIVVQPVSDYKSSTTQTGLAMLPKTCCDVVSCEIAKFLKLSTGTVETLSFTVPRRGTTTAAPQGSSPKASQQQQPVFQEDLYPPTRSGEPTMTCEQWFKNKDSKAEPKRITLKPGTYPSPTNNVGASSNNNNNSPTPTSPIHAASSGPINCGYLFKHGRRNTTKRFYMIQYSHADGCMALSWKVSEHSSGSGKTPVLLKKIASVHVVPLHLFDKASRAIIEPSSREKRFPFQLVLSQPHKIITFLAETDEERSQWIERFQLLQAQENTNPEEDVISEDEEEADACEDLYVQMTSGAIRGWAKRKVGLFGDAIYILKGTKLAGVALASELTQKLPISEISIDRCDGRIPSPTSPSSPPQQLSTSKQEERCVFTISTMNQSIKLMAPDEATKDKWTRIIEARIEAATKKTSNTPQQDLLVTLGLEKKQGSNKSTKPEDVPPGRIKVHPISTLIDEEDVKVLFSVFGPIEGIELFREGKFKDECYIKFKSIYHAENSLRLDKSTLSGEQISVTLVDDVSATFIPGLIKVTSIHPAMNLDDFKSVFGSFGAGFEHMRLRQSPDSKDKSRIAYIKYSNIEDAQNALVFNHARLHGQEVSVSLVENITKAEEEKLLMNLIDPLDVKNGSRKILVQMKGSRTKIYSQQIELSRDSINSYGVYVLDAGTKLYQFNGKLSQRFARARGLDMVTNIKMKERGGNATIIIIDEGKSENEALFWAEFPGPSKQQQQQQQPAKTEDKALAPAQVEDEIHHTKIYRVSDSVVQKVRMVFESIQLPGTKVKTLTRPSKELLKSNYVYVVDCFCEIYVWYGSKATATQKALAMKIAMKLETQPNRPLWTTVTRILENTETVLFKEKFSDYPGILPISVSVQEEKRGNVAVAVKQEPISIDDLFNSKPPVEQAIDDGTGRVEIWRVEGFEKCPYPPQLYGQFFSGDSFIIVYSYKLKSKETSKTAVKDSFFIYFYQGRDSSRNEKGASALLAVDMDDKLGGDALQIRILQHKETQHFLSLFESKFVVHQGRYKDYNNNKVALYDVRGHDRINCRAVELPRADANCLNTRHCYVLATPSVVYVWHGKQSISEERQLAANVADTIVQNGTTAKDAFEGSRASKTSFAGSSSSSNTKRDIQIINEGAEPAQFWSAFTVPPRTKSLPQAPTKKGKRVTPRLFQFSSDTGMVKASEVFNFCQDDLEADSPDVMMVDCYDTVYLWLGAKSAFRAQTTVKLAIETALAYAKKYTIAPENRVLIVHQYQEPLEFTNQFHAWSASKANNIQQQQQQPQQQLGSNMLKNNNNNNKQQQQQQFLLAVDLLKELATATYSYEQLLDDPLPPGVDSTCLESYLSNSEFEDVFKMTKQAFYALPKWKQENLKKSVDLF